ncbi:MAG: choice-of-anchor B family protein [Bacteroidetes bacterium]|nr:choice-of-anchor B family protein [Bacteroidota bacterium]
MKKLLLAMLLACSTAGLFAQLNMTLTDQIDYSQQLSSLWGYIDPEDSTEYAAVGTATGLAVVDLTDPYNVQEIAFVPDLNSQWREVKSWGHYIFAVTEAGGGVLVVNMTDPTNVTSTHWAPNIPGLGTLSSIHSITVDEYGFLYLNGSNLNSGGPIIADVSADNGLPVYVGKTPAIYCHDSYARDNKLYTSDIYAGGFKVYDVTNKANPVLLATQSTPYLFTHNTWLNDASTAIFTTDEKANAPVTSYDISDLNNIVELDQFRPVATLGLGVIPHNVHVWDDWVITAYYTEGTIIVDGYRPDNMIEVGYFDSFVSQTAGFYGVWGVYPYFPSGLVIASDMQNGLLVYEVNYVRACWLEGTVTDAVSGLPIQNTDVHIASTQANTAKSGIDGVYKTGQAIPGVFDVTFTATGYYPKTVPATLENGVLTILDVQLDPLSSFAFAGQTVKASDGSPVPGAQVVLHSSQVDYTATTDGSGNFSFPGVLGGDYTIYAGAWGYINEEVTGINIGNGTSAITISLDKGYADDFILDFGWTKTSTATTGQWERGEPIGTFNGNNLCNPELDVTGDIGDQCYMTQNGGGGPGDFDVDGGAVVLTSPVMNLSNYNQPILNYTTWFYNAGGSGNPNDNLQVRVTNGTTTVTLETIAQSGSQWRPESEYDLASLLPLTSTMQVIFETADLAPGHLVEAAVDRFSVTDVSPYPPFSSSATEGCLPFSVQFSDASDSTSVWQWTFEGGSPANSGNQNPVVVYDTPGTYDVSLTVVTASGNTYTMDRPDFITINAQPTAGFSTVTNGNVVDFTNSSTGGGTYLWNFGDNSTNTQQNPSHVYTSTGTYTVTLTVTNGCGTATFSQVVTVTAVPPTAIFSTSGTLGCAPFTVQFTSTSLGNPTSYNWTFPGGTPASSTQQNPAVVYNSAGTYSVQLTVSNAAGSNTASLNQLIQIGSVPTTLFGFDVNGFDVTFTNNSVDAVTYEWTFGDNATSTDVNPAHTYAANGNYEVTLTANNDCGFSVFTQTVNINVSGTEFLEETSYSLTASPNPFSRELVVNFELADGLDNANLLVFNVLGEQVDNVALSGNTGSVRLGYRLTGSGMYFLRLQIDGKPAKAIRVVKL